MNLTMAEQETIISYNRADDKCTVYTASPTDIAYYDKLCDERPDWIRCIRQYGDYAKMYVCQTKKPAKLHPPRVISDEERKARSDALKKSREMFGK